MVHVPVESLVREYRGWRYVIDDLSSEDAAALSKDGWRVASTEWTLSNEGMGCLARFINAWEAPRPWRPTRTEWLLTVRYERR